MTKPTSWVHKCGCSYSQDNGILYSMSVCYRHQSNANVQLKFNELITILNEEYVEDAAVEQSNVHPRVSAGTNS